MTGTPPTIPGYENLSEIGKGAMGVVYKARQASVDRVVAVKVLRGKAAEDEEFIARFRREARIAAKLSHANIVAAIDAGESEGRHYFVMEFIEGVTVQDELDRGTVYDEKSALRIILAVAQALRHAHERGLVHRDIKPANILLTRDGQVKLADLGLARIAADPKEMAAEAGLAAGTPYYISPEQARGLPDVDARADIYSLGATLYHMVTGRVPYTGKNPAEVMKKHVSKKVLLVPPDHLNTSLSSGLGELVETMMAKNREQRYQSPGDLIPDLECLLRGERPRVAEQKLDSLALLSQGEAFDAEGFPEPLGDGPPPAARGGGGSSTLVVILSILLSLSVLLNLVQLLAR